MPVSVGELLAYLRLDSSSFDRGIRVAQTEMRTATGTADRMGAAVGTTSERLTGAGRAAQVAASGSAKYRAAQLSLVAAQERYNTVLNQGNASTAKLASAEAAVIRANDRVAVSSRAATTAVSELGAAQERGNAIAATTPGLMTRTASGFAHAARSAAGLGAAFGAFELFRKAIDITKDASKFQQSMLLIQTNAGKSADEVKFMTDAVLKMSPEVATKPLDLANALYHVEQNGLTGTEALKALRAGAEGAKIGLADVEDTTNTMTIAVASGVDGMKDMQKVMGQMIAIAGTGDMRLKDLNGALSSGILGVAKGFLSSKTVMLDVGAVLATLGDNGIRTNEAATAFRMTLMGFAHPAAKGKEALDSIGLSITDLRDDMQKRGLVHAMNDLDQHMKAAGITGAKVGGFITDAFGKKAGAGVNILMGEIDRVNVKYQEGIRGGQQMAAKWDATTKTTAFAFQKIGAEVEAAGIKIATRLMPAVTTAANWLGTTLPQAISTLANILGPTASMVGTVFVGAWHALSAVLSVVGDALAGIGGFLSDHKAVVTGVTTAVLGMWAAYKAYRIGVAALKAVDLALGALAMRMNRAGGAMAAMRAGMSGISSSALAGGVALAGLGLIIAGVVTAHQEHARQVELDRAAVEGFTSAIEQDGGALGAHTRALIEDNLAKADAYQKALKLGISQKTLTDAVMGNAGAMAQVKAAIDGAKGSQFDLAVAVSEQVPLLAKGAQNAKDKAAADSKGAGSAKKSAAATTEQASAAKKAADAEQAAADAAKRLDAALQALSGNLGSRQALDQYRQGMQQLKSNLDKTNHSLVGNSAAAVANRLAVDNVVQSALQYAQALKAQGKTQPQINSALQKQIGYLVDNAKQLGLNKTELRGYLKQLGLTPKQIHTAMGIDTKDARAKVKAFQDYINGLRATIYVATVTGTKMSDPRLSGKASGGGLPEGVSAVGEQGPELAIKSGSNVHILSNSQSKAYLSATGMKAPGFSGGTDPNGPPDLTGPPASKGGASALDGGASAIAALRAAAHNLQSTGADLKDAAGQIRDAAKAGKVSAADLARFSGDQKELTKLGNRRDRLAARLGSAPTPPTAYDRLATAQQNYSNERTTVSGAVTGSFDITQAGNNQYNEPVTLTGIRAQLAKAVANAHRFTHLLKKLGSEGLNKTLLSQLAEAGPAALPQAQALASATPKQLASINSQYKALDNYGGSAGKYLANQMYGAGVNSAQALVNGLKSKESALNTAIRNLAGGMIAELRKSLDMHSPSRVLFNEARLAFSGYENGIQSKHGDIARAAHRIGGASIPNVHHASRSGGGHTYITIKKQELTVQYPESGDLPTALKQLARMTVHQMRAASQELR